jgi:hypothetical protein
MNEENVTCQDCVHNRASWFSRYFKTNIWSWKCSLDYIQPKYNPVTGDTQEGYYGGCGGARIDEKICGKSGKNWKPRSKDKLFIYLKRI